MFSIYTTLKAQEFPSLGELSVDENENDIKEKVPVSQDGKNFIFCWFHRAMQFQLVYIHIASQKSLKGFYLMIKTTSKTKRIERERTTPQVLIRMKTSEISKLHLYMMYHNTGSRLAKTNT
jgi:hypothetical protein